MNLSVESLIMKYYFEGRFLKLRSVTFIHVMLSSHPYILYFYYQL
jgi:hypothetical protein